MALHDILSEHAVCIDNNSVSKTAVLQLISRILAKQSSGLEAMALFDDFWQREHLGSTAIGEGIAIPHIRSADVSSIHACLIRLSHPIEFGAEDKKPIDILCALLVPDNASNEHLLVLADLVRLFQDPIFRNRCRQAEHTKELFYLINEGSAVV